MFLFPPHMAVNENCSRFYSGAKPPSRQNSTRNSPYFWRGMLLDTNHRQSNIVSGNGHGNKMHEFDTLDLSQPFRFSPSIVDVRASSPFSASPAPLKFSESKLAEGDQHTSPTLPRFSNDRSTLRKNILQQITTWGCMSPRSLGSPTHRSSNTLSMERELLTDSPVNICSARSPNSIFQQSDLEVKAIINLGPLKEGNESPLDCYRFFGESPQNACSFDFSQRLQQESQPLVEIPTILEGTVLKKKGKKKKKRKRRTSFRDVFAKSSRKKMRMSVVPHASFSPSNNCVTDEAWETEAFACMEVFQREAKWFLRCCEDNVFLPPPIVPKGEISAVRNNAIQMFFALCKECEADLFGEELPGELKQKLQKKKTKKRKRKDISHLFPFPLEKKVLDEVKISLKLWLHSLEPNGWPFQEKRVEREPGTIRICIAPPSTFDTYSLTENLTFGSREELYHKLNRILGNLKIFRAQTCDCCHEKRSNCRHPFAYPSPNSPCLPCMRLNQRCRTVERAKRRSNVDRKRPILQTGKFFEQSRKLLQVASEVFYPI
eukprot:g5515.t1